MPTFLFDTKTHGVAVLYALSNNYLHPEELYTGEHDFVVDFTWRWDIMDWGTGLTGFTVPPPNVRIQKTMYKPSRAVASFTPRK